MPEPPLAKLTLTKTQQVVLLFIQHYITEHHCSPFIREIQLGCQITSYKSAIDRLNALERKGFIRRAPNKHRGIRIAQKALASVPEEGAPSQADRPVPQETSPAASLEVVS